MPQKLEEAAVDWFNMSMTSWRGDMGTSDILGGAVTTLIAIAAVVVAVIALSGSQRHQAVVALSITAAVVFILAVIILLVRTRVKTRRARGYVNEERAMVVEMKAALGKVRSDLEALPEHTGSLADDITTVRHLAIDIKTTKDINFLAGQIADQILDKPFKIEEPVASLGTVISALIMCDKAIYGYGKLEGQLKSADGWLKRGLKFAQH